MPKAFVLINTQSGLEDHVLEQVRKIVGVREAYSSYGVYDLIVKVEADSMDALKDVLSHRIRRVENILSSVTLLMIEE
jgi:DNA-binding Lrp family transcriptional regulator